ncbi:hypothetical protein [Actinacidiphila alni]|uniref:hypothetical protein n=1 Tax=Actinacidiphila alni TaxID=380248 RepID=UPI003456B2A8
MPIVTNWFGYRKARPTSKRTSRLDDIHADNRPYDWTAELIELLSLLRRLTDVADAQSELTAAILSGPVIAEADLISAGVLPVPRPGNRP